MARFLNLFDCCRRRQDARDLEWDPASGTQGTGRTAADGAVRAQNQTETGRLPAPNRDSMETARQANADRMLGKSPIAPATATLVTAPQPASSGPTAPSSDVPTLRRAPPAYPGKADSPSTAISKRDDRPAFRSPRVVLADPFADTGADRTLWVDTGSGPARLSLTESVLDSGATRYIVTSPSTQSRREFDRKMAAIAWGELQLYPQASGRSIQLFDEVLPLHPPSTAASGIYVSEFETAEGNPQWAYVDENRRVHLCASVAEIARAAGIAPRALPFAPPPISHAAAAAASPADATVTLIERRSVGVTGTLSLYRARNDASSSKPVRAAILSSHGRMLDSSSVVIGGPDGHPIHLITRSQEGTILAADGGTKAFLTTWASAPPDSLNMDTDAMRHFDGLDAASPITRSNLSLSDGINTTLDQAKQILQTAWEDPTRFQQGRAYSLLWLRGETTLDDVLRVLPGMGINTLILHACQSDGSEQMYVTNWHAIVDRRTNRILALTDHNSSHSEA